MNFGLNGKYGEATNHLHKEDGSDFLGKLDLNLSASRDEEADEAYNHTNASCSDGMEESLSEQVQPGSPLLARDANCLGEKSPSRKPGLLHPLSSPMPHSSPHPVSETGELPSLMACKPYHDDLERNSGCDPKVSHSLKDSLYHSEADVVSSDVYLGKPLSPSNSPKPSSEVNADYRCNEIAKENVDLQKSPPHLGEENAPYLSQNSQVKKSKVAPDEMEGGNSVHSSNDAELKVHQDLGKSESDNGQTEGRKSDAYSPGRTPKRSVSPVKHMSVSPERFPSAQSSGEQKQSSPAKDVQDFPYSPGSSWQKHSRSSQRQGSDNERHPSHDRLSPSVRHRSSSPLKPLRKDSHSHLSLSEKQRSPSPGRPQTHDSRNRDDSPRHKLSVSPRRRNSLQGHRREDRSSSRSPVRHRDSSSRHRRDHRDRSRSRSPYARNRYRRSPRNRYSPRRRSPPAGYHSRHRSPRRRPWSPPPNRSTGVGRPGSNLFVAGFSFVTTERDLERKFSRFGRVRDVRIVRDKRSGDSRGFGFLSLERDEDADAAIRALDQTEWNGRIVLVEKSKTPAR